MEECKDCIYYEDSDTFANTGLCSLHNMYVKENEVCCNAFEEVESYGY